MRALLPVLALLTMGAAPAGAAKKAKRTVTKASVVLVDSASFLAPPSKGGKAILRGEQVETEGDAKKGWYAATHGKTKGFLHASYVADRPVAFKVSVTEVEGKSALSGSYSLAVGGFSAETEKTYRTKSNAPKKGFELIDLRLPTDFSKYPVQPDVAGLREFVAEGQLNAPVTEEALAASTKLSGDDK